MHEIKKGVNKFYIGDSEIQPIAEITYQAAGNNCIKANRTYVSEELRGQGIAKQLLDRLVSFARAENLKIIPVCSYVKVQFERDPSYQDVVQITE
ncbi:MAG: N-acetyltransferase [Firmicutes bacterium]|nr:N-acetyltransferase [Bacillota bacterium]